MARKLLEQPRYHLLPWALLSQRSLKRLQYLLHAHKEERSFTSLSDGLRDETRSK